MPSIPRAKETSASPGRLKAVPQPNIDRKSPTTPPPQPDLAGSLVRPPSPSRMSPQPAQVPHFLPQPTSTGKIIPSLVVTVLELHSLFVAESVSNPLGDDVMVVVMGILVDTAEPKVLVPMISRKKGADELPDRVEAAVVGGVWEIVDEAEDDRVCPGEAVIE